MEEFALMELTDMIVIVLEQVRRYFFFVFRKIKYIFPGYVGLICEINIDECATYENICGYGRCIDTLGSYKCKCDDPQKCGLNCSLDNLCVTLNPCVRGTCESKCVNKADYICNCEDNYRGKNCSGEVNLILFHETFYLKYFFICSCYQKVVQKASMYFML